MPESTSMMSQTTDFSKESNAPSSRDNTICEPPWPQRSEVPTLHSREVHVWSGTLSPSPGSIRRLESHLDERELSRAARFSVELSRNRFVSARGKLKELLGKYTQTNPSEISFHLGPLGKPYMPTGQDSDLYFNSTDTNDELLVAVCRSGELGIDVEFLSREVRHPEIAKRKFSRQEYQQYLEISALRQKQFFLDLWTRKEAYGKAKGVGIRYRLNSVTLVDDRNSNRVSVHDETGRHWEIVQFSPDQGVTACVVVEGGGWNFRCFRLPDDEPA